MIGRPSRPLLFGALAVVGVAAGGLAVFARPAPPTPVTVYLTPT
jgi:hypothetical protein